MIAANFDAIVVVLLVEDYQCRLLPRLHLSFYFDIAFQDEVDVAGGIAHTVYYLISFQMDFLAKFSHLPQKPRYSQGYS